MKEGSGNMDPTDSIITKFSAHPSVLKLNEVINKSSFSFRTIIIGKLKMKLKI